MFIMKEDLLPSKDYSFCLAFTMFRSNFSEAVPVESPFRTAISILLSKTKFLNISSTFLNTLGFRLLSITFTKYCRLSPISHKSILLPLPQSLSLSWKLTHQSLALILSMERRIKGWIDLTIVVLSKLTSLYRLWTCSHREITLASNQLRLSTAGLSRFQLFTNWLSLWNAYFKVEGFTKHTRAEWIIFPWFSS